MDTGCDFGGPLQDICSVTLSVMQAGTCLRRCFVNYMTGFAFKHKTGTRLLVSDVLAAGARSQIGVYGEGDSSSQAGRACADSYEDGTGTCGRKSKLERSLAHLGRSCCMFLETRCPSTLVMARFSQRSRHTMDKVHISTRGEII